MRINNFERETIVTEGKKTFGNTVKIILFGSRIHENKKGGDIDLLIIPKSDLENLFETKIKYILALKSILGEQKIDVIIPRLNNQNIIETAKRTGIELC